MNLKTLLLIALSFLSVEAFSQAYNFSVSTGTYANLEGSTSLNGGMTWDDPNFEIPIGFDFQLFDSISNVIYITEWGLGGMLTFNEEAEGTGDLLGAFGMDLIDRAYDFEIEDVSEGSLSNISYLLEGEEGSRILKIEWNNAGFYNSLEMDSTSTDFINLQLWLFEGSSDFQVHFGPKSIADISLAYFGESGPNIGLYPSFDFDSEEATEEGLELTGDPTNPSIQITSDYYSNFMDDIVPEGTIYTFSNKVVGVSDVISERINMQVSPNPTSDFLNINFSEVDNSIEAITLTSVNGQRLFSINDVNGQIDISKLASGIYFMEVVTEKGIAVERIIKQ